MTGTRRGAAAGCAAALFALTMLGGLVGCGSTDDPFLVHGLVVHGGGEPMEVACADLSPKWLTRAILLTDLRWYDGMTPEEQMAVWTAECDGADPPSDACLSCAAEVIDYVYNILHADN